MTSRTAATWPWATGAVSVMAVALYFLPNAAERCIYDRSAILHGQVWRLWTGNLVHFGASHLGWNLAVLVPAGVWAERVVPRAARWLYAAGSLVIGLSLLAFYPALGRYAGLSGLGAGLLALLAFTFLARPGRDHGFWRAVLVLLTAKIVAELLSGHALLAHFSEPGLRTVPLAHLAGVATAVALHLARRRI